MNVAYQFQKVGVLVTKDRLIPILKEMTVASILPVVPDGIAGQQGAHEAGDPLVAAEQEEMYVIVHQGPGQNLGSRSFNEWGNAAQKLFPVPVISKEFGPINPAHHDVVERAGGIQSRLSGHIA